MRSDTSGHHEYAPHDAHSQLWTSLLFRGHTKGAPHFGMTSQYATFPLSNRSTGRSSNCADSSCIKAPAKRSDMSSMPKTGQFELTASPMRSTCTCRVEAVRLPAYLPHSGQIPASNTSANSFRMIKVFWGESRTCD